MKQAGLWLAAGHVYILKYETTWLGRWRQCQVLTYRRVYPVEAVEETIRDIWQTYGLSDYEPQFVLSGPDVLWQKLEILADTAAEARQLIREEAAFQDYAVDVQGVMQDGSWDWYLSAYPKERLARLLAAVRQVGREPTVVDVLPAVMSRWCMPDYTGTAYLAEGNEVHAVRLEQDVPQSYAVLSAMPSDVSRDYPADTLPGAAYHDDCWQEWPCAARPDIKKRLERWQASLPAGILLAL